MTRATGLCTVWTDRRQAMDAREREIVRRNHRLLVHNIILTEEFFEHLRNYHVLPETMIRDVKVCGSNPIFADFQISSFFLWILLVP